MAELSAEWSSHKLRKAAAQFSSDKALQDWAGLRRMSVSGRQPVCWRKGKEEGTLRGCGSFVWVLATYLGVVRLWTRPTRSPPGSAYDPAGLPQSLFITRTAVVELRLSPTWLSAVGWQSVTKHLTPSSILWREVCPSRRFGNLKPSVFATPSGRTFV